MNPEYSTRREDGNVKDTPTGESPAQIPPEAMAVPATELENLKCKMEDNYKK
jgi:hypothetical protein